MSPPSAGFFALTTELLHLQSTEFGRHAKPNSVEYFSTQHLPAAKEMEMTRLAKIARKACHEGKWLFAVIEADHEGREVMWFDHHARALRIAARIAASLEVAS